MKKSINSNILGIIKKGRIIELENLSKPSKERILEKVHLDEILKQLNQKNISERKKELLWLIALTGDKNSEILKLAKKEIYPIRNFGEYPIIPRSLNHAIYYALCKAENDDIKNILDTLLESKSGEIRLLVAEFYLYKNKLKNQ